MRKRLSKACEFCGKTFEHNYARAIKAHCCSADCQKKLRRQRMADYWEHLRNRICSRCHIDKSISDFTKNAPRGVCRVCKLKDAREKYAASPRIKLLTRNRRHARKVREFNGVNEPLKTIPARVRCYWCGVSLKNKEATIDHITPLARGGSNLAYNKVFSCRPCNCSKRDKNPNEFTKGQMEMLYDCYKTA